MTAKMIEIAIRRFFIADEGVVILAKSVKVPLDELNSPETQAKLADLSEKILTKAKNHPANLTDLREMTSEEVDKYLAQERAEAEEEALMRKMAESLASILGGTRGDSGEECNCPACSAKRAGMFSQFSTTRH